MVDPYSQGQRREEPRLSRSPSPLSLLPSFSGHLLLVVAAYTLHPSFEGLSWPNPSLVYLGQATFGALRKVSQEWEEPLEVTVTSFPNKDETLGFLRPPVSPPQPYRRLPSTEPTACEDPIQGSLTWFPEGTWRQPCHVHPPSIGRGASQQGFCTYSPS